MKKTMSKTAVLTVALILATTAIAFAQQYAPEGDFTIAPTPYGNGVAILGYNGRGGAVSIPPTIGGQPVVEIARGFVGNTTITSLTIPNSVTLISPVFKNMTRLTTITLGTGITVIPAEAFSGCTTLTSVTIGSGVTSIDTGAFTGCTALRSITIPASVTSIGNGAFENCSSLATVTILRQSTGTSFTGTTIGRYGSFNGTSSNLVIRVPTNSLNAYKTAEYWSVLASRIQ